MVTGAEGLKLIVSFEGDWRRKARLCEGGRWEIGYGFTTDEEGKPFGPDATCDEERLLRLFAIHLREKEGMVERHVTVPLNQHQYDACVSLVYNIGEGDGPADGFEDSSVLRYINQERWEDAAAAFNMWHYATKTAAQRLPDEPVEWYRDPDGNPCPYKRILLGLERRRDAEACLLLSLDWRQACGPDTSLVKITTERFYNAAKKRNEDRIVTKTDFSEVWEVARHHKLAEPVPVPLPAPPTPAIAPIPLPAPPPPTVPPVALPQPPKPIPSPAPADVETVDVSKWDIGKIRPENGAKVMEMSDRAVAVGLKLGGIGIKTVVERRVLPGWIGELYFQTTTDPLIVAMITAGIVALWLAGHAMLVNGRQKRAKHGVTATTVLV